MEATAQVIQNPTTFEEATKLVASYFIAGIDSSLRHAKKGDMDRYPNTVRRTTSWKRGYEFGANCVRAYGNIHRYTCKQQLGSTCHEASQKLIALLRDGCLIPMNLPPLEPPTVIETPTVTVVEEVEQTSTPTALTDYEALLTALGVEYDKSPICIWFDMPDDLQDKLVGFGAKHAPKREKKGKKAWYFDSRSVCRV